MIDFGSVMKIKKAVGRDGIGVDTIIEVKVTSADGREYNTNMKLTQSDLDLFAQIRSMN